MKNINLIYVFPDQFRQMSLGIWQDSQLSHLIPGNGDPVETPNLNAFAMQSTIYPNAVSNCPLCSPYRGSLFTGQYPAKSGVPLNCNSERPLSELPSDAECLTDLLAASGYDIGYIGKWHLDFPTKNDPANPLNYVGVNSSSDKEMNSFQAVWDSYTEPHRRHNINYWYGYGTFDQHNNPHYYDNDGIRSIPNCWSAEHEANKAIDYLKNSHHQRDINKPFALFIAMNPPHTPYSSVDDCRKSDWLTYKDRAPHELLLRDNVDFNLNKTQFAQFYFASVTGVDQQFGRIIQQVKDMGEWDNTVIIFTSDHGDMLCSHGIEEEKNCIYNEAFSVPFLLKSAKANGLEINSLFINSADIFPTILTELNLDDICPINIDGKSRSKKLINNINHKENNQDQAALYIKNLDGERDKNNNFINYFPCSRGVKTTTKTLALEINEQNKLINTLYFNNIKDPYQLNNLPFNPNGKDEIELLRILAKELIRVEDPWYKRKILSKIVPY
ncbi:sulfatase [Vibrio sp. SS-MA-C1-2]|uniref:sulfatase family protein n=1 Tax=Vibrio sp. SS-MA-C1-2 TaxID=2908646 RepID=UPI001F38E48E|nr:sulfatase [Vibrio sp. SS-MA-C1-2]UJF18191.1 sulfatase [Vibrio sp. SS-MA-C1-2]